MEVQEVFERFKSELALVEEELFKIFQSDAVLIPAIGRHLISNGGKRLRPLYLLLASELCGYNDLPRRILAGVIEAIHTASLLHDDVVDGAEVRRGNPASNAIWGNQVVILVGDFIYAHALRLSVSQGRLGVIEALSHAIMKMTEGELLQLQKSGDPGITEEDYLTIVASKTGSLFSAACRIGALLGDVDDEKLRALTEYGRKAGMAFQISDDILDFEADETELGKALGKDLDEGKITLPLIYLLRSADDEEKTEIIALIKGNIEPQVAGSDLARIMFLFDKYKIIDKAKAKAGELVKEARDELTAVFGDSEQREAILVMTDYCLKRKK